MNGCVHMGGAWSQHDGVICPKPQKGIFHGMRIFEPFDTYVITRMCDTALPMPLLTACR